MDSKMLTDDENFTSLDDLVNTGSVDFLSAPESQLCVPTDSIDDVDFFPSFKDDFISLNGLDFMFDFGGFQANAEEEEETENLQNSNPSSAYSNTVSSGSPEEQSGGESSGIGEFCGGFVNRKGRSKRGGGGRSWSAKKNHLAFAMAVEEEKKKTRCTHCQTDTTPQWRMGPEGPKTLCNACGVRYKSGRLVPEYRPAASPTFDCRKHSNFHRKILKRKGMC